jgi:hypothetical protein
MLDTLQTSSLYAITGTCFALMAAALNEVMAPIVTTDATQSAAVGFVSLAVAGALNAAVVVAFVYAMVCEGHRAVLETLDVDGKGRVTLDDVRAFIDRVVPPRFARWIPRFVWRLLGGEPPGGASAGGSGGGKGAKGGKGGGSPDDEEAGGGGAAAAGKLDDGPRRVVGF